MRYYANWLWEIIVSITIYRKIAWVFHQVSIFRLFQYPAVYTNGITLVVSPLISLMQDQVRSLSVANIPACFLGSAQTDRTIEQRARDNEFRLVYVSPEYISGECGTHLLQSLENKLTLVAIDEARKCKKKYFFKPANINNKIFHRLCEPMGA